jgi:hypothetical protein
MECADLLGEPPPRSPVILPFEARGPAPHPDRSRSGLM